MNPKNSLSGDIYGGITAAAVALPLALAFGVASGLGALAGIYGAIIVGFFASLFGGTNVQISGPTGPMTVVVASIVTQFSSNLLTVFTIVMLAGLFQIGFGLAGLGRFIKLVPQTVVSGFMTGIGVIVIILQLGPLLGFASPAGSNLVKLAALPAMITGLNWQALVLGLFSFVLVSYCPKQINRYFPATLLSVILGTLIGIFLFSNAPTIGDIPSGLPSFYLPSFSIHDLPLIIRFALILAFLGSIDSLLTSLAADSKTGTLHNSNRELVGQGIGNLLAGCFGSTPGAGATMRTFVNIQAGGKSRLSGIIHSVVLLVIALVFSTEASRIPLAVLAGILLRVGINIIDWRNIKRVTSLPRPGVAVMLTTLLLTVLVDLITAVAVGIVMASVLFVSKMASVQMESIKFSFGSGNEIDLNDDERQLMDDMGNKAMLFQVEGPLSFATARDITRMMQQTPRNEVLIIDLSKVPFIDSSAAATLEEMTEKLAANGDHLVIFGASPRVINTLEKTDVYNVLGAENIVASRLEALQIARHLVHQFADS
jgi:SulP family sulfate permease